MSAPYTPSQTPGPYFHLGLLRDDPPAAAGAGGTVVVTGRVLDGAGEPVPDALLEVWQLDGGQPGACRVVRTGTGADGRYAVRTVVPPAAVSPDGTRHAPHLDVVVVAGGVQRHLLTRVYFPGEAEANATDPTLAAVDPARRASLVASREGDALCIDIVLQGEGETVFFDV